MRTHMTRRNPRRRAVSPRQIREELAILERRLAEIGPDGDSGYEKALFRFFEQQIGQRRALLRQGSMLGG